MCIALYMQKRANFILVFLAALLLVAGIPVTKERAAPIPSGGYYTQHDHVEPDIPRFLQPETPELLALPAETGSTEVRTPPFRFQEPDRPAFILSIMALGNRQKQYLCQAAALLTNFESHDIGFPFLAFW